MDEYWNEYAQLLGVIDDCRALVAEMEPTAPGDQARLVRTMLAELLMDLVQLIAEAAEAGSVLPEADPLPRLAEVSAIVDELFPADGSVAAGSAQD
ncbi:MAG: hypothetical protein ACRDYZ_05675, partial [Acidimicrobiales bacterium]